MRRRSHVHYGQKRQSMRLVYWLCALFVAPIVMLKIFKMWLRFFFGCLSHAGLNSIQKKHPINTRERYFWCRLQMLYWSWLVVVVCPKTQIQITKSKWREKKSIIARLVLELPISTKTTILFRNIFTWQPASFCFSFYHTHNPNAPNYLVWYLWRP